jgi:lipopolysaccharide export system permease protein
MMMQLDRYVEAAILKSVAMVALGLTGLFTLFQFVDQLSSVGKGRYGWIDAIEYVALTAPSLLLQITPVSMLLGTLLALGALANNNELAAMQAVGISGQRIAGWIFRLALPIVIAAFFLAEFVIPPAQHMALAGRTAKISSAATIPSGEGFWAHGDNQYLNVGRLGYGNNAKNIDIYSFSGTGEMTRFIHAERADIRPDGIWQLSHVLRKQFDDTKIQTDRLPLLEWKSFLHPHQVQLLTLPPDSMPPIELYKYVRTLKKQRQQATRYEQELWTKISFPLTLAAMILIAIPFVFGPPRTQSTGQRITIGASIGIVFSLSQQIAVHLGLLLNINPAIAAMTPSLILMTVALYLFNRAHI